MLTRLALLFALLALSASLPLQVTVNQREMECLYEKLDKGETVTVSVFILSGPKLVANVHFDGPIAPTEADSGIALQEAYERFDRGERPRHVKITSFSEEVNFEHLNLGEIYDDDDEFDDDDDEELTAEQRKERRARQRRKALEARQKREQHATMQKKKVREEGEAFQKTMKVDAPGWYRFCVKGNWYQQIAEIDIRKESELGGLNENGHVMTYEQMAMAQEDKLMEEDTATEEGIKDEDFSSTKDKLKQLRRLLADIQSKQQQERHRLIVHAATNEHSHSRMVLGSLLETILFMVVTGIQIMTIRRWFKGAPVLGR